MQKFTAALTYLKGAVPSFPPMINTISSVNLILGSNPMLPPGDDSNIKPKSMKIKHQLFIINSIYKQEQFITKCKKQITQIKTKIIKV